MKKLILIALLFAGCEKEEQTVYRPIPNDPCKCGQIASKWFRADGTYSYEVSNYCSQRSIWINDTLNKNVDTCLRYTW